MKNAGRFFPGTMALIALLLVTLVALALDPRLEAFLEVVFSV